MTISTFRVKHPRPKKLSDPTEDFTPAMLNDILATPDNRLYLRHYKDLFGPFLPAGTYSETIYFLPGAFRYALAHDADAHELMQSLVWFVSVCKDYLAKDGLLDEVRACIRELLDHWTATFEVIHMDREACRTSGSGADYLDYVKNAYVVVDTTAELIRFESHADIAEQFVWDLALNEDNNPQKAAWFLEYASHRKGNPPKLPRYEPIQDLVNDNDTLKKAVKLVEEKLVPTEPSPTYWRDTIKRLNIWW